MTDSAFGRDTRVEPVGDGRFAGEVTQRWSGLSGNPLGGYVLAIGLRALQHTVPLSDLLVVSAYFLERVTAGPVQARTRVLRAGRRTATGEVGVYQGGREAIRATATFADLAAFDGPTHVWADPPALAAPEDSLPLYGEDVPPRATVTRQVEFRVPRLPGWRAGAPSGTPRAEFWMRLTEGGGDDVLALPFLVDCAAPAIVELGAIGSTTLQLTLQMHHRPPAGWLACRATTRFMTRGLHEEDFEIWDRNGTLIAQSRQVALPRNPG